MAWIESIYFFQLYFVPPLSIISALMGGSEFPEYFTNISTTFCERFNTFLIWKFLKPINLKIRRCFLAFWKLYSLNDNQNALWLRTCSRKQNSQNIGEFERIEKHRHTRNVLSPYHIFLPLALMFKRTVVDLYWFELYNFFIQYNCRFTVARTLWRHYFFS